jgi:hypothetical protein
MSFEMKGDAASFGISYRNDRFVPIADRVIILALTLMEEMVIEQIRSPSGNDQSGQTETIAELWKERKSLFEVEETPASVQESE